MHTENNQHKKNSFLCPCCHKMHDIFQNQDACYNNGLEAIANIFLCDCGFSIFNSWLQCDNSVAVFNYKNNKEKIHQIIRGDYDVFEKKAICFLLCNGMDVMVLELLSKYYREAKKIEFANKCDDVLLEFCEKHPHFVGIYTGKNITEIDIERSFRYTTILMPIYFRKKEYEKLKEVISKYNDYNFDYPFLSFKKQINKYKKMLIFK